MGIVSTDTLAKNRKYAVLLAFVAAALLTPTPDAFNQLLMAVPIILLYEVGILASRILKTSPKKE
jgi:sec-independent protein translocase protein TatC